MLSALQSPSRHARDFDTVDSLAPTLPFWKWNNTRKSSRSILVSLKIPWRTLFCPLICLPFRRTATENMYTLLQPPRSAVRVGSPNDGSDGKLYDGKTCHVLCPAPVPGIPHPCVGGSKHPFYSPREVHLMRQTPPLPGRGIHLALFSHPLVF